MSAKQAKTSEGKYAIIQTGGKQYRVQEGDIIDVELLKPESGSAVHFDEVLFVAGEKDFKMGPKSLKGYSVTGELLQEVSGPKVVSMKFKRSHNTVKKFGHRQHYSRVKIVGIGKKEK